MMPHPRYSNEEIAQRGEDIYTQKLRAQIEPGNSGKYLVIDVDTEDFEIGDDSYVIAKKALTRHADAALFGMRIGFPAPTRMGGRLRPNAS